MELSKYCYEWDGPHEFVNGYCLCGEVNLNVVAPVVKRAVDLEVEGLGKGIEYLEEVVPPENLCRMRGLFGL